MNLFYGQKALSAHGGVRERSSCCCTTVLTPCARLQHLALRIPSIECLRARLAGSASQRRKTFDYVGHPALQGGAPALGKPCTPRGEAASPGRDRPLGGGRKTCMKPAAHAVGGGTWMIGRLSKSAK